MTDALKTISRSDRPTVLERALLGEVVSNCLAPLAFLLIMLITVDGLLPQLEMFLSGGHIPVPTMVLKFCLAGIVVLAAIVRPRWELKWFPMGSWIVFVIYLAVDIPHLLAQHLTFFQVLSQYYAYYSLILLLPLVGAMTSTLRTGNMIRGLMVVFWCSSALGLAQHYLNSPIVYTQSADGTFNIQSGTFVGTELVRAFSLFMHGVHFGLFSTLVGAMGLFSFLQKQRQWSGWLVYCVAGLCTYVTLTRAAYLAFAVATFAVLALQFGKSVTSVRSCSVFGFLLGCLIAYGGALNLFGGQTSIADNASLVERLEEIVYYWARFTSGDIWQKMLGLGIVQDVKANGEVIYPIDNMFLAVLLHLGIVGLIIFVILFWKIWRRISARAKDYPSPLTVGVCALWTSFLVISLFDISIAFHSCAAMMMILCDSVTGESLRGCDKEQSCRS